MGSSEINLTSDIDMNEYAPLGIESTTRQGYYSKVIYGNGHTIRNLRTHVTNPVSIFEALGNVSSATTFNDVDFVNLCLDAPLVSSVYSKLEFNCCRFTGRRDAYLLTHNSASNQSNVSFNRCFFNFIHSKMPIKLEDNNNCTITLTLCKIKHNCLDGMYYPGDFYSNCNISGCYFYGDMAKTVVSGSPWPIFKSTGPLQSLFNCSGEVQTITVVYPQVNSGDTKIFVNKSKIKGAYTPDFTYKQFVSCTDEEMKSAIALYSKGLDIVVEDSEM